MHRWMISILGLVVAVIAGCSLKNTHLYGSEQLAPASQAVIAAVGQGLQITAINDETVSRLKTASFVVPPGHYKLAIYALKDIALTNSATGSGVAMTQGNTVVQIDVQAGHTYIPVITLSGKSFSVTFEDKGLNYPTECLPLYKVMNDSTNPGHALYRSDKRCEV